MLLEQKRDLKLYALLVEFFNLYFCDENGPFIIANMCFWGEVICNSSKGR